MYNKKVFPGNTIHRSDSMNRENIILRIRKLLELSKSSNINESQNAILKAQELLIKHNLSMREVKD